jgi:SAM-dependent methyltransferase
MTNNPLHRIPRRHLLLGAGIVVSAVALLHWPAALAVIGAAAGIHVALATGLHVALGLAGGGILVAAVRSHKHPRRHGHNSPGQTLHSARSYDWVVRAFTFGREARLRELTLDVAGVVSGERVLDVGCGTGTLALAAQRRVGAGGAVYGIDASPEMVQRARAKSAFQGLPVGFDVATAQALPFPDAAFDVVLCSLAVHHLPRAARHGALAEMRRVLKPEGRALIVEFSRERGLRALLNPVALLHTLRSPRILDEAAALMQQAGFASVITAPLGFGGLGYALARR